MITLINNNSTQITSSSNSNHNSNHNSNRLEYSYSSHKNNSMSSKFTFPSSLSIFSSPFFFQVPNDLINESTNPTASKLLIPLFLYSAFNSNKSNNNIVDTNLIHISETFYPFNPTNTSHITSIAQSLYYLNSNYSLSNFTGQHSILSNPLISKTKRLVYQFSPALSKATNKSTLSSRQWTKITYNEYNYILDVTTHLNLIAGKTIYNTIELLNVYCFLKMKISLSENLIKSNFSQEDIALSPSLLTFSYSCSIQHLAKHTNLSKNTISKYLNQLEELQLIHIKRGQFLPNSTEKENNQYGLSSTWEHFLTKP